MTCQVSRSLLILGAVGLLADGAAAQRRDGRLFESPSLGFDVADYFTARYAYASCVADFDRDGDADVATVTWPNMARLTVVRNAGGGMFDAPEIYPLPVVSNDVMAADVDGDGAMDLLAAHTGSSYNGTGVSCFRNRGDGTFEPARTFATGRGPVGLAVADFDLDGDGDLVVAEWFSGQGKTVSLLRNRSEVGELFAPRVTFEAGHAPHRVVAADLDGDGAPDLAVANGQSNVGGTARLNLLFNDRAGGFTERVELSGFFAGLSFFPNVIAADMDLDGDADLIYADSNVAGIVQFENLGGRSFGAGVTIPGTAYSSGPNSMAVGDVTGDGWPDVVGTTAGWTLWPSSGGGAFGPPRRYSDAEAPYDIDLADADGDGDLDPIIVSRDSLEARVHFNPGNGEFGLPPGSTVFPGAFDHGDIDGDGDLDIVSAGGAFEILRNRGDGTFLPVQRFVPPTTPHDVKLRDIDADGDLDLIWNEDNPPYRWGSAVNNGAGAFSAATIWPVATCGYFGSEIDAFDLDGDGDLDVVQIESLGCGVSGSRVFINENVGGARFALAGVIQGNPNPRSVAGGDFDHDGNLDLAVTGQPTTILLGRGDLTFVKFSSAMVPGINIATADFDRDGNLDLAIALQRNVAPFVESMVIQLGTGKGSFLPPVTYLGSHSPYLAQIQEIALGDADRDGNIDVMCLNYASNDVSLWRGNGDGTFQRHVRYGAGMGAGDLAFADFTGDGIADLACNSISFPPWGWSVHVIPGIAEVTHCQPNLGFHGPGSAFASVCGQRLASGATSNLLLVHAPAGAPAFLGVALAANPTPVLGGTWVPNPIALVVPFATGPQGSFSVDLLGGGGPADVIMQLGYLDPAAALGVGLTNAMRVELLP